MRHVIPTLAFTLALGACGAPVAEEAPAAASFETNYTVISEDSHIRFSAVQEGTDFEGRFSDFDAYIFHDPAAPETSRVRVSIPLAGVEAGSTDRNSTLPGEAWFDRKRFPVAIFEADGFTATSDGFVTTGTLSMKGVSAEVELPFTLTEEDGRTVMSGSTVIDRTDWNVGAAPWNTDEYVSRAVELDLRVVATKE